ncbi:carboxypeptidase-like regulatory domain-containing protein, partial [bacterium]|nr:carboxypeptidase-like regulatory domain-containing protein [bacterium]
MKKISIFLSLMLLTMATAFAQNVTVSGSIKDAVTDEAIPGASVLLKGTRTGAVADLDGNYSIRVPSGSTLVFSSIGYQTEEVVVNGSGNRVIPIALQPDSELLSDVLVVAYGTAKKESFTGSAQTIKSEQIEKRTVANVTKAL